jgi:hypothetical protein
MSAANVARAIVAATAVSALLTGGEQAHSNGRVAPIGFIQAYRSWPTNLQCPGGKAHDAGNHPPIVRYRTKLLAAIFSSFRTEASGPGPDAFSVPLEQDAGLS